MAEYILFLRETPDTFRAMSPEQMQSIIGRYEAWRESLAARGLKPAGKKLRDGAGKVVRGRGAAMRVSDGPFSEAREVIGGFFSFTAASFEEAVTATSDCPHLEFGSVEIREIEVL